MTDKRHDHPAATADGTAAGLERCEDHRDLLERMVTEQPRRLPNRMLASVRDRTLAEDLSQETLTRALRSLATLRGPAEEALVCGWLDAIATNVLRNHARTATRRPLAVELDDTAEDTAPSACGLPEKTVADAETRQAVSDLIAGLPPEYAEVFVARIIDEIPTADVAEALGISQDLVRYRLHRARVLLRERLEPLL
jgi:RNA polymerase sigma-70 factor (ECF subfamily)